jgi:hypothetical protein
MTAGPGIGETSGTCSALKRCKGLIDRRSLIGVTVLCIFTIGASFPFFRVIFGLGGDEGVLLNGAIRLLEGQKIYIDFFEFLPPGGFLAVAGWFSVFGATIESARCLAILTITAVFCLLFLVSRRVVAFSNFTLLAVCIPWVLVSQGLTTQVSHHWITTAFSMLCFLAVTPKISDGSVPRANCAMAGLAAGIACVVTPHQGVAVCLAGSASLYRRARAGLLGYFIGCCLVPVATLGYLFYSKSLEPAFADLIGFTIGRYTSIQSVPFGFGHQTPIQYVFPAAALLTAILCTLKGRGYRTNIRLWTCSMFAVAGLAASFPRPDVDHLLYTTPLAGPLLIFCIEQVIHKSHALWRKHSYVAAVVIGVTIGVCAPSFAFYGWTAERALQARVVSTQRGRAVFLPLPGTGQIIHDVDLLGRAQPIFFYPIASMLSFLSAREQASKYDVFLPWYTRADEYREACLAVMRKPSWIVFEGSWASMAVLREVYPAMPKLEPPEKRRFEDALIAGSEFVREYNAEVVGGARADQLRRLRRASQTLCESITE